MAKEIFSARQSGKTLQSLVYYVSSITPIEKYTLYIKQELFDKYIDILSEYITLNVEVCGTSYLPKNINAIYTKNIDVCDLLKGEW